MKKNKKISSFFFFYFFVVNMVHPDIMGVLHNLALLFTKDTGLKVKAEDFLKTEKQYQKDNDEYFFKIAAMVSSPRRVIYDVSWESKRNFSSTIKDFECGLDGSPFEAQAPKLLLYHLQFITNTRAIKRIAMTLMNAQRELSSERYSETPFVSNPCISWLDLLSTKNPCASPETYRYYLKLLNYNCSMANASNMGNMGMYRFLREWEALVVEPWLKMVNSLLPEALDLKNISYVPDMQCTVQHEKRILWEMWHIVELIDSMNEQCLTDSQIAPVSENFSWSDTKQCPYCFVMLPIHNEETLRPGMIEENTRTRQLEVSIADYGCCLTCAALQIQRLDYNTESKKSQYFFFDKDARPCRYFYPHIQSLSLSVYMRHSRE